MAWVTIEPDLAADVRFETAGPEALALHIAALCHCTLSLSNGFLTRARARILLVGLTDPDATIDALIAEKFWESEDACRCNFRPEDDVTIPAGQLHIANYLRTQWSRKRVDDRRVAANTRLQNWREKKAEEKRNAVSSSVASDVANSVGNACLTQPNPTQLNQAVEVGVGVGGSTSAAQPGSAGATPADRSASHEVTITEVGNKTYVGVGPVSA